MLGKRPLGILLGVCGVLGIAGYLLMGWVTSARREGISMPPLPAEQVRNSLFLRGDGRAFAISPDGLPTDREVPALACEQPGCIIGIHGMMFDNFDGYYFNPHQTQYASWRRMLGSIELKGIGWQSVPTTWAELRRAWGNGHATWYGQAVANADALAPHLARMLARIEVPFDVMCHSLGCYLALKSFRIARPPSLRRVILLNAAVSQRDGDDLFDIFSTHEGYNVVVEEDGLLGIAAALRFSRPGSMAGVGGIERGDAKGASNVVLNVVSTGATWSFDMDNPNRLFNHLYAFEAPGPARVIRTLVDSTRPILDVAQLPAEIRKSVKAIYPFSRK